MIFDNMAYTLKAIIGIVCVKFIIADIFADNKFYLSIKITTD